MGWIDASPPALVILVHIITTGVPISASLGSIGVSKDGPLKKLGSWLTDKVNSGEVDRSTFL